MTGQRGLGDRLAAGFCRPGFGLCALIAYVAFAIFLTWPLIGHLDSTIYISPQRPRGDYTSTIAYLHQLVDGWHVPFLPGRLPNFNAPDGLEIAWILNIGSFASWLVLYPLAVIFGATAAFNIFLLLGFIGSAFAMFLLVRWLTGNAVIAIVIGFAFGFFPYFVANGEHPHFLHGWVFVLMTWRMLELLETPTRRNGVLAGLATLVAIGWTPYFLLLGGIFFAALFVGSLIAIVARHELARSIGPQLIAAGMAIGFVVLLRVLASMDADAVGGGTSPLSDLYQQSARPVNFVMPNGHSPIFGEWSRPYLAQRGWHDAAEKTLYVGISILVLAVVAVVASLRRRLDSRAARIVFVVGFATFAAFVFSGPPKVNFHGTEIPLPPFAVWKLQPGWRIYERFVIVGMLGLCVLAAFGIQALIQGRGRRAQTAILIALAVIVPLDLWSKFEPNTARLPHPAIYETVRKLPPGIVVEYPIEPTQFGLDYDEQYNQQFHGKPILNGYPARTNFEGRALSLSHLDAPDTAARLYSFGVRYALVKHRQYVPLEYVPRPGKPGQGFKLIKRDSFADLYRVLPPKRP